MTVATFTVEEAARAASEAVREVAEQKREQVREEVEAANVAALAYAKHLAEGGDPVRTPAGTNERWDRRSRIVSELTGISVVYEEWNRARGSRNTIYPFGQPTRWRIAERLLASLGEPVSYAELSELGTGGFGVRVTSEEVQKTMRQVEEDTNGELLPRRTKVGGKVAFYLRERRSSDAPHEPDQFRRSRDIPTEAP